VIRRYPEGFGYTPGFEDPPPGLIYMLRALWYKKLGDITNANADLMRACEMDTEYFD
jgi:hypothetical protein